MRAEALTLIDEEEDLIGLLRERGLYLEDDVTFTDLDSYTMAVYTGDDFDPYDPMLEELGIGAFLVEGSVTADLLRLSDVLGDFGVLCITGDLHCQHLHVATECTSLCVGGDLVVDGVLYASCGNSGVHVRGDLQTRMLCVVQCELEVGGTLHRQLGMDASAAELAATFGIVLEDGERVASAVKRYLSEA